MVFFSSHWFFFYLLSFWSSHCIPPLFFQVQLVSLWPLFWTFSDRLLISVSFRSFSEVLCILSSGIYSFVSLFCLALCFYILSRLAMLPSLKGVVLCRRYPGDPIAWSSLVTRARCSRRIPLCGVGVPPYYGWSTTAAGVLGQPWRLQAFWNMGPATQVRGHFGGMPVLAEAACQVRWTGDIYFFFPSQTVSSFIKDTFHKQSWYFRQDMGRQLLTIYNFQTPFFKWTTKIRKPLWNPMKSSCDALNRERLDWVLTFYI